MYFRTRFLIFWCQRLAQFYRIKLSHFPIILLSRSYFFWTFVDFSLTQIPFQRPVLSMSILLSRCLSSGLNFLKNMLNLPVYNSVNKIQLTSFSSRTNKCLSLPCQPRWRSNNNNNSKHIIVTCLSWLKTVAEFFANNKVNYVTTWEEWSVVAFHEDLWLCLSLW